MAVWSVIKSKDLIKPGRIDSEYFKPEFLNLRNLLAAFKPLNTYINSFTHPTEFKRIYSKTGCIVLRAQNTRPLKIDFKEDDLLYLDKNIASKCPKNILRFGDILMTRTGANFGQTALYTKEFENAIVTSHTFIIRVNEKISSSYIALFLNTYYGWELINQGMYGASQPEIAPKYIKDIPIPRFSEEIENKLSLDVLKAYDYRKESVSLYKKAEKLLEQALRLDKIQFEKPKSYTANFSEVVSFNRNDADYFQTKYRQIEKHIENYTTRPLISLCSFIKGFEVGSKEYTESGKLFIRVSNINNKGFHFSNSDKFISEATYNSLLYFKPSIGEILLTKDGTVGLCYVVDEEIEGIISSGIVKLIQKDTSIPKEYLALAINSQFCQMQIQRECSGALILHWKPEQIRKLKIPIISEKLMKELAEMVIKSKEALRQSKQLLEQAKKQVENLIEQAAGIN